MMQEYKLGQFLKDRYVDKLINSSYKFSEVCFQNLSICVGHVEGSRARKIHVSRA